MYLLTILVKQKGGLVGPEELRLDLSHETATRL